MIVLEVVPYAVFVTGGLSVASRIDGHPRQSELDAVADRAPAHFAATDQRPRRSHLEREVEPHGDVGKRDGVLAELRVPRRLAQRREIDDVNEVALFAVRLFSPPERP